MTRLLFALFLLVLTGSARAAELPRDVGAFLEQHCLACHGEKKQKGGVRFDSLKPDFSSRAEAEQWLNAMDSVNAGDMPPEEKPRPGAAEIGAFTGWIAEQARLAEARRHSAGGRTVLRRLNRFEYANTVRDLLGVEFNTAIAFPIDEKRHGFDRIGASLTISPSHLEKYAEAAGKILDRAIVTGPPPKQDKRRIEAELVSHPDERDAEGNQPKPRHSPVYLVGREGSGYADVERVDGQGAIIRSMGMLFTQLPAATDGEYIIRVRGYGVPFEGITPRLGIRYGKPGENTHSYLVAGTDRSSFSRRQGAIGLSSSSPPRSSSDGVFTRRARSGRRCASSWRCSRGRKIRAPISALSEAVSTGTTTSLSTSITAQAVPAATCSRHCR